MGVSLVLQCRPPAGLPPPVIFWMDNSELLNIFAHAHIIILFIDSKIVFLSNDLFLMLPLSLSSSLCFSLLLFSPRPPDFQRLSLNERVSQALNGDLYFSNVLPEDTRRDYICYARFPHTQTIQQKQPISVTVLESKSLVLMLNVIVCYCVSNAWNQTAHEQFKCQAVWSFCCCYSFPPSFPRA